MNKKINVLTCGGTIDKDYGSGKGVYDFHIGAPCIGQVLTDFGFSNDTFLITELMRKDSLDMDDNDRQSILMAVNNSESQNILITHGTDTMIESGEALGVHDNKIIIFMGASRPYSMKTTDAEENIKFAWDSIQKFRSQKQFGIYIAMNGEIFSINNVQKCEDGVFRKINL